MFVQSESMFAAKIFKPRHIRPEEFKNPQWIEMTPPKPVYVAAANMGSSMALRYRVDSSGMRWYAVMKLKPLRGPDSSQSHGYHEVPHRIVDPYQGGGRPVTMVWFVKLAVMHFVPLKNLVVFVTDEGTSFGLTYTEVTQTSDPDIHTALEMLKRDYPSLLDMTLNIRVVAPPDVVLYPDVVGTASTGSSSKDCTTVSEECADRVYEYIKSTQPGLVAKTEAAKAQGLSQAPPSGQGEEPLPATAPPQSFIGDSLGGRDPAEGQLAYDPEHNQTIRWTSEIAQQRHALQTQQHPPHLIISVPIQSSAGSGIGAQQGAEEFVNLPHGWTPINEAIIVDHTEVPGNAEVQKVLAASGVRWVAHRIEFGRLGQEDRLVVAPGRVDEAAPVQVPHKTIGAPLDHGQSIHNMKPYQHEMGHDATPPEHVYGHPYISWHGREKY